MQKAFETLGCLALAAFLALNFLIELTTEVGVLPKLLFAAVFSALWTALCLARNGRLGRGWLLGLFGYYLWLLLNVLFFDAAFGRGVSSGGINLLPFRTIRNYLRAYALGNIGLKWVLINLAGNLAAFAPLGFLLPALLPRQRTLLFLPTIIGSIAAVECLQLFTRTGSCDIDDLILNAAGALLGWLCFRLLHRLHPVEIIFEPRAAA